MKKTLVLLAATLALPLITQAGIQRVEIDGYRMGDAGAIQGNDGRLTASSSFVYDPREVSSVQQQTNLTLNATIPAGQKFSHWWYWYYKGDLQTQEVVDLPGATATAYLWNFNAAIQDEMPDGHKVVYFGATYDYIRYKVAFNGNGSTSGVMDTIGYYSYDAAFNLPANAFAKTGYSFANWSSAAGRTFADQAAVSGASLGVTADEEVFTLSAAWTPNTYTVAFDKNGGDGSMANQGFTYDVAQALTPNGFTRTGYRFMGWADTSTGSVKYGDGESVSNLVESGTKTLYAVWYQEKNLAFDGHGATSGDMTVQGFTNDTERIKANTFEKTGYTFAGWATNETENVVIFQDEDYPTNYLPEQGATNWLYATWAPNHYTVVFNGNGGIIDQGDGTYTYTNTQAFVYDEEKRLNLNTFTRSDLWSFLGWSTSQDATSPDYVNLDPVSNLTAVADGVYTLYGVWDSQAGKFSKAMHCYNLKWTEKPSSGNWTVQEGPSEGYAASGSAVKGKPSADLTALFSKKGILSFYWKPSSESTSLVCYDKAVSSSRKALTGTAGEWQQVRFDVEEILGDLSLGARTLCLKVDSGEVLIDQMRWEPEGTYYVAYDPAGGEGMMETNAFLYGESDVLAANAFTRTGYTFADWLRDGKTYEDRATVYNLTNENGATVVLLAEWTPIQYTVVFNGNGGQGTMADQTMTYDAGDKLNANAFSRDGYSFLGWAESADATVAAYADGASPGNLASTAGAVVTLYAVWSKNPDPGDSGDSGGGGSGGGSVVPVDYDSQLFPSDAIGAFTSRSAATYTGWLRTATGEIAGQIKVKTGAVKSSGGEAKVTITVTPLSGKKRTYKTTVKAGGNPSDEFGIIYGGLGLTGVFGEYIVEAVKDVSKAATPAERALAAAIPKGVWTLAFETGAGYAGFSVAVGKKGKAKVSGVLPTGTKVNVSVQGVPGEGVFAVPVLHAKRGIGFVVWFEGAAVSVRSIATPGWSVAAVGALRNVADGTHALSFDLPAWRSYLTEVDGFNVTPDGEKSLTVASGKWKALKSVGKVAVDRDGQVYVKYKPEKQVPVNLAALKLSCAVKTGLVQGSFKLYWLDGVRLKRDTVKAVGVTVGGSFYGSGSVKKLGSFPIRLAQ